MTQRLRLAVPSLLLGLVCFGCAAGLLGREVLPPDVFLTNVKPIGMGLFEQRIELTFRVTNPNDFELPIEGGVFDLAINGAPFARGVTRGTVDLPALGESFVTIEASTTTAELLSQLRSLGNQQDLSYALTGHFTLDDTLSIGRIPFTRQSQLGRNPFLGGGTPAN